MKIEFVKELGTVYPDTYTYLTKVDGHYQPGTLSFDQDVAHNLYLKEIEKAKNPKSAGPEILESVEI